VTKVAFAAEILNGWSLSQK